MPLIRTKTVMSARMSSVEPARTIPIRYSISPGSASATTRSDSTFRSIARNLFLTPERPEVEKHGADDQKRKRHREKRGGEPDFEVIRRRAGVKPARYNPCERAEQPRQSCSN